MLGEGKKAGIAKKGSPAEEFGLWRRPEASLQRLDRMGREEKRQRAAALQKLLFGGFDFGGGVCVLLGEALDAAGGVHELLFAGKERVAVGADFDAKHFALYGGASLKRMTAGAVHRNGVIVGVDSRLHGTPICRVRSARPTR